MTKEVTNLWPIYVVYDDMHKTIIFDREALAAIERTIGNADVVEAFVTSKPDLIRDKDRLKYMERGSCMESDSGLHSLMACLLLTSEGRPPSIVGTSLGATAMSILVGCGKYDMAADLANVNVSNTDRPDPGVLLYLAHAYKKENGRLAGIFEEFVTRPQYIYRWPISDKSHVMKSVVTDWRHKILVQNKREGMNTEIKDPTPDELRGLASMENEPPELARDFRRHFMWMCADPYLRLKRFDRPDLTRTIESLKANLPFALPDELDLNTRDARGIISGIRKLSTFGISRVSKDPLMVYAILNAYLRLASLGPVSAEERDMNIYDMILGFCMYIKSPLSYVGMVESRMPENVKINLTIYLPVNKPERLARIIKYLCDRDRLFSVCVTPVQTLSDK